MRKLTVLLLATTIAASLAVPAVASPPTKKVKIGDSFFGTKRLTIHKGTKVTWNWTGFLDHNVSVVHGPSKFHSRIQTHGSFSHVFTKKGTYYLHCALHPNTMKMTIKVK